MHRILLSLTLVLASTALGHTANIDITAIGGWSRSITAADLQSGAGSDLVSTYESASDAVLLTIRRTGGKAWRVYVRRVDTTWHGNFILSVRRTGDGTGGGTINGGLTYQAVDVTDSAFVSGWGDRNNIPVQFELAGMSLQVPPNTYATTITYTVVQQ